MFASLIDFFLQRRMTSIVLAVAVLAGGWFAFSNLTVEAFPDPSDYQVEVITLYPGQPTEEVERAISIPLERSINGVPGLTGLRSISLFGLSQVSATFADGVDPYLARQQVLERIGDANLPTGVQPSLGPLATPIGEVYRYTLEGASADPMELRTLQDWTVRPRLLQVPGVADVVSYGGLVKEIHVVPDPTRMAALGIGLSDIFDALKKGSDNATGGYLERGAEAFVIRSLGIYKNLDEIGAVRVGYKDGVPVRIRNVCEVECAYAPRQGIVTRDANEDAVEGIVLMRRSENPSKVLEALRTRVDELNDRALPKGVRLVPFYDRTELVHTTLTTVFKNILEGAMLVVLVLFAFMLSLKASLIVASIIPLSLCASFIYLYTRGMSANLLSIGAVDFGIIVDGAVILVEQIFHRVGEHAAAGSHGLAARDAPSDPARAASGRRSIDRIVLDAAREVARPTFFSLLIIIAAYIPIFTLQRVEGRIFAPMAHTVVSALLGALVFSFTLVPVLAAFALRKQKTMRESPLLRWVAKVYKPTLSFALGNPVAVFTLAACGLAAALVLASRLGTEFLPELNEGGLYMKCILPGNTSLTQGRRLTPRVKDLIARTPEVSELLTQLGRPEDGTDPKLPNNLEVFIKLKPMAEWRPEMKTLDDLGNEIETNLSELPGVEYNVSQPIRDNVNENISGQSGEIALKIYGEDMDVLASAADKAKAALGDVPGIADLAIVKSGEMPQIAINVDRDALARYDLDLGDVQDYAETALNGHVASSLWEGEKHFDVTVRLPKPAREDINSIRRVMLPLKDGALIPLSGVADVAMGTGRAAITRENGRRYVGLRMNVHGRDLGSFVAEARGKLDRALDLPAGYEVNWGGEFENQERAMARLRLVLPLAIIITFLLLFSAFNSTWDCLLILSQVPFAMIGGIVGLALFGMPLSVSAAVGFIALLGQSVLNGVLVMTAIQARRNAGESLIEAVKNGAHDRLRAVLMTGLLASLGLLPAALSHAIGSETQRPLAVVVVCGTVSAFALTLVLLPVAVHVTAQLRERLAWKKPTIETGSGFEGTQAT
jgi:cobalt-zinc-cadmium resistance protein CzcA